MKNSNGSKPTKLMNGTGFGTEKMVAVVTLSALAVLILIRMGFRGVGVPLTNVRVGV